MSYLAEKYAHLLTKDDVLDLFEQLEAMFKGNLSEVCRRCEIQRKTKYDWGHARIIKLNTKKKILKTMFELDLERALNFLLKHCKETSVEILSTYLSHIYSKTMRENIDPRAFIDSVKRLEKIKSENAGLTWELEEELGEMMFYIREKAKILKVALPEESVEAIRPVHFIETMPSVIKALLLEGGKNLPQIAANLQIPERLVHSINQVIMQPIEIPSTELVQSDLSFNTPADSPTAGLDYPSVWNEGSPWQNTNMPVG